MKTLVLATRNAGKAREFQELLGSLGYTVLTASEAGYDKEPKETGKTFRENALIKAEAVAAHVPYPVLADDSGLEVEALNGAPGVHSARYARSGAKDENNRRKLLSVLKGQLNRRARFVCALCFLEPGKEPVFFEGHCLGSIEEEERGKNGFGYDSVFIPEGETRTFAEMEPEEKNPMSHRGKAMVPFLKWLADKSEP
jgi:XTP/dITP diphosphohydrolase